MPPLTVEDVKRRVAKLREDVEQERGDEENWHHEEDQILGDVLQAISDGADQPMALAVEALKVDEIDFAHWYA